MSDTQEYFYVVLEKSHTGLGHMARFFDKYEYTHITYCLDGNLEHLASFSRQKHYAPFSSGYSEETLDCFAYGKHESVKLKVFKIPVAHENNEDIKAFVKFVKDDRQSYVFNLFAALTMSIFHGFRIYKAYNCMSFVGKIIELSGVVTMDKKYYKYDIKELDKMLSDYVLVEKEFTREAVLTPDYMDRVNIFVNIGQFFKLVAILLWRLITKNPDNAEYNGCTNEE